MKYFNRFKRKGPFKAIEIFPVYSPIQLGRVNEML